MRLDYYDILPKGMAEYLSNYGHHFSKAMCAWAVSGMTDRNEKKVKMKDKEHVDNILRAYNINIENNKGYDAVFVYHMAISDFLGSSILDESGVARYIKDLLDDVDGYDGIAFDRFIMDCNSKGIPVIWEDMI